MLMQKLSDEQGRGFILFDAIDDCTFVFELWVETEFQRQGVGTRLVQRAIEATGKPRLWVGKCSAGGMALARKFDPAARFRRLTPSERMQNEPHVTHVHLKPETPQQRGKRQLKSAGADTQKPKSKNRTQYVRAWRPAKRACVTSTGKPR